MLDADLYGPDILMMIGLTRQERLRSWNLWRSSGPVRLEPVERFGIRVMSAGFLLGEDQALAFAAPLVQVVLHQLLTRVAWDELDELLVDLPARHRRSATAAPAAGPPIRRGHRGRPPRCRPPGCP